MTVLFVVKAVAPKGREDEFNRWYDDRHVPDVLKFPGVVSARRYQAIAGEDRFEYMAVYELRDEATYRALMASDHMKYLVADYDKNFPGSERMRFAYRQIFP
jgi:hypothetical protein